MAVNISIMTMAYIFTLMFYHTLDSKEMALSNECVLLYHSYIGFSSICWQLLKDKIGLK